MCPAWSQPPLALICLNPDKKGNKVMGGEIHHEPGGGSVLGGLASLTAGGPPPPAPRCPEGLPGQQPVSGNSLCLNPASFPGGASGILPTEAALGDRWSQACSWCWRLADGLLLRLQQRELQHSCLRKSHGQRSLAIYSPCAQEPMICNKRNYCNEKPTPCT